MKNIINSKGRKTTLTSIIGIVLIMFVFVAWWLEKITTSDLKIGIEAVGLTVTFIGLLFAKDQNKSHTIK